MRALLDTHAVFWVAEGDAHLGTSATELLRTLKTGEAVISDITLLEDLPRSFVRLAPACLARRLATKVVIFPG